MTSLLVIIRSRISTLLLPLISPINVVSAALISISSAIVLRLPYEETNNKANAVAIEIILENFFIYFSSFGIKFLYYYNTEESINQYYF